MFGVVLDTCVLVPSYLRDTLLTLAEEDMYQPLWSDDIFLELSRRSQVPGSILTAMRATFPEALVSGYEPLVDAMPADSKDRHVLAAAVRAGAAAVVTANGKDFDAGRAWKDYGIEVLGPDDFLSDLVDLAPSRVLAALRLQIRRYRRPPLDLPELLHHFETRSEPRLTSFAAEVRSLPGCLVCPPGHRPTGSEHGAGRARPHGAVGLFVGVVPASATVIPGNWRRHLALLLADPRAESPRPEPARSQQRPLRRTTPGRRRP